MSNVGFLNSRNLMDLLPQSSINKNHLSSTGLSQPHTYGNSFLKESFCSTLPFVLINPSSRPQHFSLHSETPNITSTQASHLNSICDGDVAYVKPMACRTISSIEGPMMFQSDQDEFSIFGTSQRLRSELCYNEINLQRQTIEMKEVLLPNPTNKDLEGSVMDRTEQIKKAEFFVDNGNRIDEKIVEHTITTSQNPQAEAEVLSFNYPAFVATNSTHSIGVGDSDVNQCFLLDTSSRSVNPAAFPSVYWKRLRRYFREHTMRSCPSCKDVALQLSPPKQRTVSQAAYVNEHCILRNFGVCVKPIVSSVGFTTDPIQTPEKQDTACITDDLDECFALLLRSICAETPKSDLLFIKSLHRYSRTNVPSFIRLLVERLEELRRLKTREVSSYSLPKPQMSPAGSDPRFAMLNKRTFSEPPRQKLKITESSLIYRSQDTLYRPKSMNKMPKLLSCYSRNLKTSNKAKFSTFQSSSSIKSHCAKTAEPLSGKPTTHKIKSVPAHVVKKEKISSNAYEAIDEEKSSSGTLFCSPVISPKDLNKNTVTTPISTPSNSYKHCLSEKVVTQACVDKDFPKRVAGLLQCDASPNITVSSVSSSKRPHTTFPRTFEVACSSTLVSLDDSDSISTLQYQRFLRTGERAVTPPSGTTALYQADSPDIPLRNYTYKTTSEFRTSVEVLNNFYMISPGGTLTDYLKENLDTVRKEWFKTVSQGDFQLEQIEDLFAFLYNSAPQLLCLLVRIPETRGSTCLHYAVGHGAWRVVDLILNTGYADANQRNALGFSPIMIAAISDSIDASAVPVAERLLLAGDVNARAGTASGQTPLMLTARKTNNTVMAKLLLRHGADVNVQDSVGNTALMCAIDCGNAALVKLLTARPELNVNLKDHEGATALSLAKASRNEKIIKSLQAISTICNRHLFEPRMFRAILDSSEDATTIRPTSASYTLQRD